MNRERVKSALTATPKNKHFLVPPWLAASTAAFLTLVFMTFSPAVVTAQSSATLNRFRAAETPDDDFNVSRPTFYDHLRWSVQLHFDYALNPLVWEEQLGDSSTESIAVVRHQLNANLGFSLGLANWLVIYAGLPVVLVMNGADESEVAPLGVFPADGAGLADVYLGARVRLYGLPENSFAIALQVTGTFPTSGDSAYSGDDFLSIHPEVVMEVRPGAGSRITLDVGAYVRRAGSSETSNFFYDDELTLGLGFGIPIWTHDDEEATHLDFLLNINGALTFQSFGDREATSFEMLTGLRFHHASGFNVGLGAGPGIARGLGSPDLRLVFMAGYGRPRDTGPVDTDGDGLMDPDDECPNDPEDFDEFEDENGCPDPDNDEDGILDVDDDCPNEPEDIDEFEDENGCPDPDNDQDSILDVDDECPTEPEDFDEFEDENGCPDPDNDEDGILDVDDECPNEPGPVENNGCPDPDRDGDTVVDRLDNCPDEPGPPENQGCRLRQRVRIERGRLEIMERVFFRTNSHIIQARSYPLLNNVAQVLNAHPEITLVRVEGHTDSRGRHQYNMDLSQRRAESVVRRLVQQGRVDEGRLEARGFGPDRPRVSDASTRDEHAQNRRVEFNIPGGAEGIEERDNQATSDTIDR